MKRILGVQLRLRLRRLHHTLKATLKAERLKQLETIEMIYIYWSHHITLKIVRSRYTTVELLLILIGSMNCKIHWYYTQGSQELLECQSSDEATQKSEWE